MKSRPILALAAAAAGGMLMLMPASANAVPGQHAAAAASASSGARQNASMPARPAAPLSTAVLAKNPCKGSHYATLPVSSNITNVSRTLGGWFYWKAFPSPASNATCVGTVRMYVRYTSRATKTWRVHVYDGSTQWIVAQRTFTLNPGYYWWTFPVHRWYPYTRLCAGATATAGFSCRNI